MKKIFVYILLVAFAVALFIPGEAAYAADSIDSSVTISPTSLPGEGTASVSVKITNNGDPISNVRLKYPSPTDTVITIGDMATGDSKDHVNSEWHIYDQMLGQSLAFTVIWVSSDGSEKSGQTKAFTIQRQDATVKVSGTVTAEPAAVDQGAKTQFVFAFKNEGNVDITNARLTAPPIDEGAQIGETFSLAPGETNYKTYNVPINADMTVNAVYSYEAGGQQFDYKVNPINVTVNPPPVALGLNVNLQADKTTAARGDEISFTISIQNTGNSRLDGLSVSDFNGNKLNLGTTFLEIGGSASGTVAIPVQTSGNYSFVASAVGAGGETVNVQSNSVAISIDGSQPTAVPDNVDADNVVRTTVEVGATSLPGPGEVKITASVQNLTDFELKNIVVLNDIIGTIGTRASLPGGETATFEKTFTAESTAGYIFKTSAQLPDGRLVESQTGEAMIEVGNAPAGMSTSMLGFIIVLAAIVVVGIVLAVYLFKSRKKITGKGQPSRPIPSGVYPQQTSASGRPKPERYQSAEDAADAAEGPRAYRSPRTKPQRVETIDPNEIPQLRQRSAPRMANGDGAQKPPTPPPPRKAPSSSNVKFGDRNKF